MAPPPASCSTSGLSDSCQPQSALVVTVGRHFTSSASPHPVTVHISRVSGTESRARRYFSAPRLTGGHWELPSIMTVITGVSWRACCSWRRNASTETMWADFQKCLDLDHRSARRQLGGTHAVTDGALLFCPPPFVCSSLSDLLVGTP